MSFNIGTLGSFNLRISGVLEEDVAGKVQQNPFSIEVQRIDTPSGFDILSNCPISFGQVDEKHKEDMGEKRLAEARKEEHEYLIKKIELFVPSDFVSKLRYIPYLKFIAMVDYMLSGDEMGNTISMKYVALLNQLRESIEKKTEELKKKQMMTAENMKS